MQEIIQKELLTSLDKPVIYDIFLEIYNHSGCAKDEVNVHKYYFDFLINYFPDFKNSNILEVACGCYPSLAEMIAFYISGNQGLGNITVIDPLLVVKDLPNIILEKKEFTKNYSIGPYNLLIGQAPCEATVSIIERACAEKKDMSILLCGSTHFENPSYYVSYILVKLFA